MNVIVMVGNNVLSCIIVLLSGRKSKNKNNNILYSSQREIKAVVRSHNEEYISIILSH